MARSELESSEAKQKKKKQPPRKPGEVEADVSAALSRLSADAAGLVDELHPKRIAQRQVAGAKQLLSDEVNEVKSQFVREDGTWRTDRIIAIAVAVLGLVGFVATVQALGNRSRRSRES